MRLCIPETCGGGGRAGESPTTLRYLIRNKWLAAEQEEGTFMIRLGKRAKSYARNATAGGRSSARCTALGRQESGLA